MFRRSRRETAAGPSAEEDVDRIVSVRLLRATRRTERLLRRIDALERRVGDLEARVARVESKPARAGRFRRRQEAGSERVPGDTAGEGARIVASQMLGSGIPADRVAEHLHEVFDVPEPERVVDEVAGDRE
jgi:hypothetical protein